MGGTEGTRELLLISLQIFIKLLLWTKQISILMKYTILKNRQKFHLYWFTLFGGKKAIQIKYNS